MRILDCDTVQGHFTDFIENTLPVDTYKRVEEHLTTCPVCQALFKRLQTILRQLHSLPQLKTSPDFNQRLLDRIQNQPESSFWTRIYHSPVTKISSYAVAAGLVIALLFTQWMEPIGQNGQGMHGIAGSPEPEPTAPAFAEQLDSSVSDPDDSLNLTDPDHYIDPDKLRLVNTKR